MDRYGLVGWVKPIGRHGVPWKMQSMKVWLACSESVTSRSTSSISSSMVRGSGQLLCRIAAWHAVGGILRCERYVRRTTSFIKPFPCFPENGQVLLKPYVTEIAHRHLKSVP